MSGAVGGVPSALGMVRTVLARLAEERVHTGGYSRETWLALCRHLERLTPEDARRVSDAVHAALTTRAR